jgi:hypothetical protein
MQDWQSCQPNLSRQRRKEMKMPSAISTWFLVLFFLFFGLSMFGLAIPAAEILIGIFALGAAIFLFLGK